MFMLTVMISAKERSRGLDLDGPRPEPEPKHTWISCGPTQFVSGPWLD